MSMVLFSPVCLAIVVTIGVLLLMARGRKTMLRVCLAFSVLAFFGGITLYTVAYMPEISQPGDMTTAMLRGLFSTGRMFLINDDYGFLAEAPGKAQLIASPFFQIPFWLCHVLALIVSVSAIMGLFGSRIINIMRLRLRRYKSCTIICGDSDNAIALGENVARHDSGQKIDSKNLLVYLVPELRDELYQTISDFGAIPMEYEKNRFSKQLCRAGLGAKRWRIGKCRVVIVQPSDGDAMTQLKHTLSLAAEFNLPAQWLSVYVLSESSWVKEYLEDTIAKKGIDWHVYMASEAELAARRLVQALPPCKALKFEKAVAQEDLTVMILGFGKTGVEVLRRLIMNGQFIGSNMKAVIVDSGAEQLKGSFEWAYPGLAKCCNIEYHSLDVGGSSFTALLEQLGTSVNYVVAALNEDSLNFEAGQTVLTHYRRKGSSLPCMALAVRHGEGAGSENEGIAFFSRQSDIYSESAVIHEETDELAMAINYTYAENNGNAGESSSLQLWYTLDYFARESNRATADFVPAMLHLAGTSKEQLKNKDSLTEDARLAENLAHTEHLRWNTFHLAMGYTAMPLETMTRRFLDLIKQDKNPLDCRKDETMMQHACLIPWENLPDISNALNQLLEREGFSERRNFQQEDYAIIRGIPSYIKQQERQAEGGKANAV